MGYYGLIPSSEFITGSALTTAVGMTKGSAMVANDALGWFKFSYKGKPLYIPKKVIRNNVSWNDLYNLGLIYGDDTIGKYPTATPTLQNKKVTIGGKEYRVRVMKFRPDDPAMYNTVVAGSELYDLFLKIYSKTGNPLSGVWDMYTPAEIGIVNENGEYTLGMETTKNNTAQFLAFNVSYSASASPANKSVIALAYGWRPVLEQI